MNTRKSLLAPALVAAFFAAALSLTVVLAAYARGEDELRRQVNVTPPVSLAEGQTLRINFFNTGRAPLEIIPCIFDADGAHLKTGELIRLAQGETRSFELSRTEGGRRGETSVIVRAGVHCDGSVRKHLVVSGEIVDDASGRSDLFVPGLHVGFDPQPDPPVAK